MILRNSRFYFNTNILAAISLINMILQIKKLACPFNNQDSFPSKGNSTSLVNFRWKCQRLRDLEVRVSYHIFTSTTQDYFPDSLISLHHIDCLGDLGHPIAVTVRHTVGHAVKAHRVWVDTIHK